MTLQYKFDSQIGAVYLVASDAGLEGVYLSEQSMPVINSLDGSEPATQILKDSRDQLSAYFKGQLKQFDLPLNLKGTAFQKSVWSQLLTIPYGETRSYKELACAINNQKAVRAVGGANGKNPLCIIIPCHRVIAADGTLGGYSGGLNMKTQLLDLERRHTQEKRATDSTSSFR